MPDNPGLGTPSTTAVFYSIDEGHAMLDATRAARKLFKEGTLSERNALIGHSAGGHAVYSAAAFAASYGLDGTLDAAIALNSDASSQFRTLSTLRIREKSKPPTSATSPPAHPPAAEPDRLQVRSRNKKCLAGTGRLRSPDPKDPWERNDLGESRHRKSHAFNPELRKLR